MADYLGTYYGGKVGNRIEVYVPLKQVPSSYFLDELIRALPAWVDKSATKETLIERGYHTRIDDKLVKNCIDVVKNAKNRFPPALPKIIDITLVLTMYMGNYDEPFPEDGWTKKYLPLSEVVEYCIESPFTTQPGNAFMDFTCESIQSIGTGVKVYHSEKAQQFFNRSNKWLEYITTEGLRGSFLEYINDLFEGDFCVIKQLNGRLVTLLGIYLSQFIRDEDLLY